MSWHVEDSWRLEDERKLVAATGRKLLRVAASGANEIEFVFERAPGESAEMLVTVRTDRVQIGEIDLPSFGDGYGLGVLA